MGAESHARGQQDGRAGPAVTREIELRTNQPQPDALVPLADANKGLCSAGPAFLSRATHRAGESLVARPH
jgi:hypothetical protein